MHPLASTATALAASSRATLGASTAHAPQFAGTSASLDKVLRQIECLAPFEHATVLIEGESGTGKSYLALMEAAMLGDDTLTVDHYVGEAAPQREVGAQVSHAPTPAVVRAKMRELGSATATAKSLGISRWTVYRYLEREVSAS